MGEEILTNIEDETTETETSNNRAVSGQQKYMSRENMIYFLQQLVDKITTEE